MFKESFAFALSLVVDLVDADFFIPRCHGKVIANRGEGQVGDAVLWRRVQRDILGNIACGVGLGGSRCGAHIAKERRHPEVVCESLKLILSKSAIFG